MKSSVKLLVLGVLTIGGGLFALQVAGSEQSATPPATVAPADVASQPAAIVTGDLSVDMNTWRETGFVTKPVSVSRPRR
jgi:hypothetical protein